MCGRYALGLRPGQVRALLQADNMPMMWEYPTLDDEGDHHPPRQSYNFAPGYHGLVYRAEVPDYGAGPLPKGRKDKDSAEKSSDGDGTVDEPATSDAEPEAEEGEKEIRYELSSMKWGLIPSWTKRSPDYTTLLKTINCRSDSLAQSTGMWTSMKGRKRCVVIAQGFYEWLSKPNSTSKHKIPHHIKRKDGKLLCMAGLWDCVHYEGEKEKAYTYTIVTTDSNAQLKFLHDRMPVILDNGSEEMRMWLDPGRWEWSKELQGLLRPYEGELEIYPVSQEVGKVGNNSPTFIVPLDSSENKNNIANFFGKGPSPKKKGVGMTDKRVMEEKREEKGIIKEEDEDRKTIDHDGTEDNAPLPVPKGTKRSHVEEELDAELPTKKVLKQEDKSPVKGKPAPSPPKKSGRTTRSATSNGTAPPKPPSKENGSQKITSFFSK